MPTNRHPAAIVLAMLLAAGCAPAADGERLSDTLSAQAEEAFGSIRLSGVVEAVRSRTVLAPQLRGVPSMMVITHLVESGSRVETGDVIVEFDPQEQATRAFDARAEVDDVDAQIARRRTEHEAAEARDRTELVATENDVARARLAVATNDLIASVEAEKNTLALEQAEARLAQLETTYALKREAEAADLRILEIRRARAARALDYALANASLMQLRAPFAGLVVLRSLRRSGSTGPAQIAEGDEVRAGLPVVDIVDTSAMQVRARVNQADATSVRIGQAATVRLDGFPELVFEGRVESLAPLATVSEMSPDVRFLEAMVSIRGAHARLLPDLTASVEIEPAGTPER